MTSRCEVSSLDVVVPLVWNVRACREGTVSLLAMLLDDLLRKFKAGSVYIKAIGQEDGGTAAGWGDRVYLTDHSCTAEENSGKEGEER